MLRNALHCRFTLEKLYMFLSLSVSSFLFNLDWSVTRGYWSAIIVPSLSIRFHYMAISDERQRVMPTAEDRASGHILDYQEAVLLTNPSNSELEGEVNSNYVSFVYPHDDMQSIQYIRYFLSRFKCICYVWVLPYLEHLFECIYDPTPVGGLQVDDKYQYSCENQENKVHGWISSHPPVGFWMITPSHESHSAGPVKQDLTSHVGPTTLNVSDHPLLSLTQYKFRTTWTWAPGLADTGSPDSQS